MHAFVFSDILETIDHTTACTIATSLTHSKRPPKLLNLITFLLFLNLFTGSKLMRIQYKVLTLPTYKTLVSGHPSNLHSLLSIERNCSTCSSSLVTLNSPNNSRLKITNRVTSSYFSCFVKQSSSRLASLFLSLYFFST
jgi:hypothetical protein